MTEPRKGDPWRFNPTGQVYTVSYVPPNRDGKVHMITPEGTPRYVTRAELKLHFTKI